MASHAARPRRADWRTLDRMLAEYRAMRLAASGSGPGRQAAGGKRLAELRKALARALNDRLRRTGEGGRVFVTGGVSAAGDLLFVDQVLAAVSRFEAFTPDNDPYEEHDCGAVEVGGVRVLWKIDAYDAELRHGSPDPADPELTTRVLTIMLPEEY